MFSLNLERKKTKLLPGRKEFFHHRYFQDISLLQPIKTKLQKCINTMYKHNENFQILFQSKALSVTKFK